MTSRRCAPAIAHAINAPLPFEDGERILGLEYWNVEAGASMRATVHDFERWRAELTTFDALSAARVRSENLVGADGRAETIRGAEMSASAFRLLRVAPALGRFIEDADEIAASSPVVLLGHEMWQAQFGGDPGVLGRVVQLGRIRRTIVGSCRRGSCSPIASASGSRSRRARPTTTSASVLR